jgi:hypothetical protein
MKVILEYNETNGDLYNTYNSQFMANIGMGLDLEKYVDTRKMKEYVAMAKDFKR